MSEHPTPQPTPQDAAVPARRRVRTGRFTHAPLDPADGELVVFLLGMTVQRWWRPDLWLRTMSRMGPMLAELSRDPDSGLAGFRTGLGARGPFLVQYWTSLDKLYAYASQTDARHRPAWTEFNRMVRSHPDAVGVWHETYTVARAESVYVATAPAGLAAATGVVPIGTGRTAGLDRARDRLHRNASPAADGRIAAASGTLPDGS